MCRKRKHTVPDRSSQPRHRDGGSEVLDHANSHEYQICTWHPLKIVGGGLFICWWLFVAYMVFTSHKDGLISYIAAYSFLAVGLFAVIYVLAHLKCEKFLVSDRTITRYCVFAPPRIYQIQEITKVVIHKGVRGGTEFRCYIGKKTVFTLHDGMVNCNLFLATLQEN